jgi:hypothetical protein
MALFDPSGPNSVLDQLRGFFSLLLRVEETCIVVMPVKETEAKDFNNSLVDNPRSILCYLSVQDRRYTHFVTFFHDAASTLNR